MERACAMMESGVGNAGLFALGLLVAAFVIRWPIPEPVDWLGAALSLGLLLLVVKVLARLSADWEQRYRSRIAAQLEASGIAFVIGSGDLRHEDLAAHVPYIFRYKLRFPLLPKAHADSLRRIIWQVGFNLDWYLGPPRRLLRWSWWAVPLLTLVQVVVLLVTVAIATMATEGRSAWVWLLPVLMGGLMLALDSLRGVAARQVGVWTSELLRYLRERTAA
jgi:hypothetical protein